jgi:hypothetical protein
LGRRQFVPERGHTLPYANYAIDAAAVFGQLPVVFDAAVAEFEHFAEDRHPPASRFRGEPAQRGRHWSDWRCSCRR